MSRSAFARRNTLTAIEAAVQTLGQSRVKPSVYFRPTAQPISKRPAITRYVHAIALPIVYGKRVCRRSERRLVSHYRHRYLMNIFCRDALGAAPFDRSDTRLFSCLA